MPPPRRPPPRLDQARHHQRDGPPVAGAGVGRRKADHRRAQAHQGNRQDHRRLAAMAIGIGANQNAAQRPHEEADAERGKRQQQRQMRIAGRRKEQYADVNNEEVINTEIEKLQRIAEGGGEYDLFAAGLRGRYYCRLVSAVFSLIITFPVIIFGVYFKYASAKAPQYWLPAARQPSLKSYPGLCTMQLPSPLPTIR